ncbi:MAG: PilZ domain-containing protein [Candidatus Omnitrophica bacterium]|nr:PilZ domain-containing protein [Candidatus Omnitrophota bacterium]
MGCESDEREHKRVPTAYIVKYKPRYSQNDYFFTQTNDVSNGGTIMLTERHFFESTQLEMHIQFPFVKKRIGVIGEVVECNEITKDKSYTTRIKFVEMSEDSKLHIAEIIQRIKNMRQK